MSEHLGLDLWIKRDDLTGFAFGGNKGRKLEYLIPEIQASGAETVVTCGSLQSNFVRQLGAACRMIGVRCVAVVMELPFDGPAGKPDTTPLPLGGNARLGELFGIEFCIQEDGTWDRLFEQMDDEADRRRANGETVMVIPVGGSSVAGAYSFMKAGEELGAGFDAVVTASSSGSTQVGLAYHFAGTSTEVIGVACDPEPELPQDLSDLALRLDDAVGKGARLSPEDFHFPLDWVGPGYGVPSDKGQAAFEALMQLEGIPLDPVYSAKAFSGLIDMAADGRVKGRVCFWHTGGLPSLLALPVHG